MRVYHRRGFAALISIIKIFVDFLSFVIYLSAGSLKIKSQQPLGVWTLAQARWDAGWGGLAE